MSDSGKAVFLSYASQDAEAAKRICEALRAAGVEVWFDQSELVGGDAWDQKIRKQIGSCALFVPIISASTQARLEGYFRLEWKLADRRTDLIGKSKAFLLPVCIDDTRDAEADVPDSFLAVQWTKLPGGETPPAFAQRVKKLLGGGPSEDRGQRTEVRTTNPIPAHKSKRRLWLVPVIIFLAVSAGIWQQRRNSEKVEPTEPKTPLIAPASPVSEARQLVAKAWEQMNKAELARAELETADELCKHAAALDPLDAEVWAAWSQVDSWYLYHNFDSTPARRESARTKAARALQLAPGSYEAGLAQACYLIRGAGAGGAGGGGRGGGQRASMFDAEAESLLRALLLKTPDEPRALLSLGILLRNTGKFAEAREVLGRMAKSPAFAAQAWNELGWAEYFNSEYRAAETAVDTSIALQPYWGNLILKGLIAQRWRGDLDQAKATLERIPVAVQQEDNGVSHVAELFYLRRDPENMLRVLNSAPREWLHSNGFDGPKAYWAALAHRMAGQGEAAQVQWRKALNLVERRLADQPDSGFLLRWKGLLLAAAGDRAEGGTVLRLARDMGNKNSSIGDATDQVLLGNLDAALTLLEQAAAERARLATAAMYRLYPMWDPLREQPRFKALLARMEADPRFSPTAKLATSQKTENGGRRPDDGGQKTSSPSLSLPGLRSLGEAGSLSTPPDAKSVAVLAFANLSDDKANEYFSDGISEELLNVLAKIPGLKVMARTSSFHFKGKDTPIADIAAQLGVAYVVEGSVRKQGDKVRITAQLIKAADGFHVWSDTFTRDLKDIFAVQDEIAGLIAQNLQLKLDLGPARRVVNPEAHRLVLEGRYYWNLRTNEGFTRAEAAFTKALEIDPRFAAAHAGLAGVCVIRAQYRMLDGTVDGTREDIARARTEAERAIALDPQGAEAYAVLAYAFMLDGKLEESDRHFQKARTLNPNSELAICWHGLLKSSRGRLDEAIAEFRRASELDPLWFINLQMLAWDLHHAGRTAEALAINERAARLRLDVFAVNRGEQLQMLFVAGRTDEAVELARWMARNPDAWPRWHVDAGVVWVLAQTGHMQEANDHAAAVFKRLPPDGFMRGHVLAALGKFDEALPYLERTSVAVWRELYWSKRWDRWRDDPRFQQLMARLGCAEEYKTARETLARMLKEQEFKP